MNTSGVVRALASGVLVANAAPHGFAAATGATHLTPLAGRGSGPVTNAVWSAMNMVGGIAIARRLDPDDATVRRAFKVGVVGFAAWALASEWLTDLNS